MNLQIEDLGLYFLEFMLGKLKGYNAEEVYRDGEKLYSSIMEANRLYMPDGLPVIFDLQVEAEVLGCELMWAIDSPPTVKTHPLMFDKKIPCRCKLPKATDGRLPMILDVMKRLKVLYW